MTNSILFIINKFAGGGFRTGVEGKILDAAAHYNWECTIEFTRSRGHATELATDAVQKNFSRIVAVGGDGTVNEVARGLVNSGIPMGIVPKGSGNGLSRHLGIPLHYARAIDNVFTGAVVGVDTFLVNGHLSLNVSGIGFDGHVANQFGKDGKRGLAGYVKQTVKEFLSFEEFATELLVDGKSLSSTAFIMAMANSSQYGNNACIAPQASVTDGLLHVVALKKVPAHMSMPFMIRFFSGQVQHSAYCQTVEGRTIEIKTKVPVEYHVDGEPCGATDVITASIQPQSLRVVIPDASKRI